MYYIYIKSLHITIDSSYIQRIYISKLSPHSQLHPGSHPLAGLCRDDNGDLVAHTAHHTCTLVYGHACNQRRVRTADPLPSTKPPGSTVTESHLETDGTNSPNYRVLHPTTNNSARFQSIRILISETQCWGTH